VIGALGLSVTGAALIALSGGRVDISAAGAGFALTAAAAFGAYLLVSERLMRRTDSLTTGAWVAIGASAALLTRTQLGSGYHLHGGHLIQLGAYGVATGGAFTLMFAALRRLGSSQTAVVMTLEAVFAIGLAAVFLHEGIGAIQVIGGAAILLAAIIISLRTSGSPSVPRSGRSGGRPAPATPRSRNDRERDL
jgi:drug/metabolite transporter (DMT)-like permease